ncbi:MAG: 2-deoxy-5-keto-D-gluconate 6-phosphate aldolase domain-containing protein [Trebonia sp.]
MTRIFALAFDHRNSFLRDFMGLRGSPTAEHHAAMVAAKGVIVDALLAAAPQVDAGRVVLLIDDEYGGGFVPKAQAGGIRVAMPVEVSGQRELRYLCGGHPDRLVAACQPDYVKVLIRYNPGGDTAMNARQRARLRELASWLDGRPQQLFLELLVPPEDAQLEIVARDRDRFDREVRGELTAAAIREIAGDGLRPRLWKIEGPESREDAARIAEAVRSADPGSACLVLGRGADLAAVRRWLAIAAATDGFTGFAVGRTLWWDALRAYVDGGDQEAAVAAVATRYLDLVRDYVTAA